MASLTLRGIKGEGLTHKEADQNFGTLFVSASITSDKRLKSQIVPIASGLEVIKQFSSYTYKKAGKADAGFIAQEVQESIPYSVHENEEGVLTMNDRPVLAHLHKAILELEERIKKLEGKE